MSATENPVKSGKVVKTWRKTRVQGLYQHRNGRFFSRTFLNGRENWTPLETEVQAVAEAKHAELRKDVRQHRKTVKAAHTGKLTFGEALKQFFADMDADTEIKPATRHYKRQVVASMLKDWPELSEKQLKRVSEREVKDWAQVHGERASSTRFNAAVGIMRAVFDVGVKSGVILANPAKALGRQSVENKRPELPQRAQFLAMLDEMRKAGGRFSRAGADFVAGLAFTGMRLNEAANLRWQDVDFERGKITVRGDAKTGTKNWEIRDVPMIPRARELFATMKAEYPDTKPGDGVFRVHEAQNALDRAGKIVGAARITHHGLRHLFATLCIESGVDIPTVSRWLGHKDGGALAMKTYGHLRDEHSRAAAAKVTL